MTFPGSDHLSASIEESSLEYPRMLVPSSSVNGRVEEEIKCESPADCVNKCLRLNRASRDGGLPAPQTCALCEGVCASNVGTTIFMAVEALTHDVANAIDVASSCLGDAGLSGCVCNIFQFLRPAWLDNLPSPQQKCSGGNVFGLISTKIIELITSITESSINGFVIAPVNNVLKTMLGWLTFGNPPQVICLPPDLCSGSGSGLLLKTVCTPPPPSATDPLCMLCGGLRPQPMQRQLFGTRRVDPEARVRVQQGYR